MTRRAEIQGSRIGIISIGVNILISVTKKMNNRNLLGVLGCLLVILSILLGCATDRPKDVYRGYPLGLEQPESMLAELDMGAAYEAIIDDMHYVTQAKYGSVRLPAGVHRIKWSVIFGVSVMVDARGYAAYGTISNINLEAGHRYKLLADRTFGSGYQVFFWIEDLTAGKIVYGNKKP